MTWSEFSKNLIAISYLLSQLESHWEHWGPQLSGLHLVPWIYSSRSQSTSCTTSIIPDSISHLLMYSNDTTVNSHSSRISIQFWARPLITSTNPPTASFRPRFISQWFSTRNTRESSISIWRLTHFTRCYNLFSSAIRSGKYPTCTLIKTTQFW